MKITDEKIMLARISRIENHLEKLQEQTSEENLKKLVRWIVKEEGMIWL